MPRKPLTGAPENYGPVLSTAQVAALLQLDPNTVLIMVRDGRLPAQRLPGTRKYLFILEDVLAHIRKHPVEPVVPTGADANGEAQDEVALSGPQRRSARGRRKT